MDKKKILIFDDDTTLLELISIIFKDGGYEVDISQTSHNILEKVSEFHPDIILMDNWIPNIGGIEATKLLKSNEQFRNIPVLYLVSP